MPEQKDKSVAELVFDVSERTSTLIREEVELAKTEITEKVTKILRGSAVGVAAGVFAFLALILIMEGIAWLLNEEVFDNFWAGFFVEAAVFLLVAAAAGLFAYRSLKAGSPPVPAQAIEEAKLIRETIEGDDKASPPAGPAMPVTSPPLKTAPPKPAAQAAPPKPAAAPPAPPKPGAPAVPPPPPPTTQRPPGGPGNPPTPPAPGGGTAK